MLNNRILISSVVLTIMLLLTARFVTARTEVISDPSNDPAAVMENQPSTNQNKAPIPSYRSPLDECFDVSLREAASCRNSSQAPVPSYRSPREVCFDVPLGGAVTCPIESPTLVPSYRSPLDECFDVSLREVASCRAASQAPIP